MSLEAQDSPTTRTTCRILILLFIVISVQANVHTHHSFDVIGPGYQVTWSAVSPRIPAAPPDKADMDVRQ